VAGSCEQGSEISVSITGEEFSDPLNNYRVLKQDCAPRNVIY
jgi:hypothetical protein